MLIDGTDVRDFDLPGYRQQLGVVPQEAYLFAGTVRDAIAYGRPDASDAEVEAAARGVGAIEMISRLPGGFLHEVSERGRNLAAGQRQLIALARAYLVDPAILLLDEATAALDLAAEAEVNRATEQLARAADHHRGRAPADHGLAGGPDHRDGRRSGSPRPERTTTCWPATGRTPRCGPRSPVRRSWSLSRPSRVTREPAYIRMAVMDTMPVNLTAALSSFDDVYDPRIVARMNDYDVRIAHARGEHVWHVHADTDEFFLVLDGQFDIAMRADDGSERTVSLRRGDVFVVPKGTEHKPSSVGQLDPDVRALADADDRRLARGRDPRARAGHYRPGALGALLSRHGCSRHGCSRRAPV